jgi:hypothetical protein
MDRSHAEDVERFNRWADTYEGCRVIQSTTFDLSQTNAVWEHDFNTGDGVYVGKNGVRKNGVRAFWR